MSSNTSPCSTTASGFTTGRTDGTARAADYVRRINDDYLSLDRAGLDMLAYACEFHSDGLTEADITIQTCWDADRLDLGRVGIRPSPGRLCTDLARDPAVLDPAYRRSIRTPRG